MMKRLSLFMMFVSGLFYCIGQNIDKVEYFIDSDPGFGQATEISVPNPGEELSLNFTVNTGVLSKGFHWMVARARNDGGKWGLPIYQNFYTFDVHAITESKISSAEYFIDDDPGFGDATVIPVETAGNDLTLSFNVNAGELSQGFHTIVIRACDELGKWSHPTFQNFYIFNVMGITESDIVKAEYFIDDDPGFGNGTAIPVTSPGNQVILNFNVNTVDQPQGMHNIIIRACNELGTWSTCTQQIFYLFKELPPFSVPVTQVEYYIDEDPGEGNGAALNFPHNKSNITLDYVASLNAFDEGDHIMYIRSKDLYERWGSTYMQAFTVLPPNSINRQIINWFKIYPNPTSSNFNIDLDDAQLIPVVLTITDLSGKMVYTEQLTKQSTRITVDLPKGLYIIRLKSDNQQFSKKLMLK